MSRWGPTIRFRRPISRVGGLQRDDEALVEELIERDGLSVLGIG
jgi:hypothetical protein